MKLSEAIEKGQARHWLTAEVRKNPSAPKQWFVMLVDRDQLSHMLVDEDETPIVNSDLNYFSGLIKEIGVREFTVYL